MGRLGRILPITAWLPAYDRRNFRLDLVAGVTVAALIVPKNLGYAGIARIPLQNGLYAAAAGALIYALFGTSRQISTGPSSALAAVAGSAVLASGVVEGAPSAELVAAIAVVTGGLFLVAALLRMGWISQFLSKAVITGFLFGAAIEVVVGELPKISGTSASGDNAWQEFADWLTTIGEFHRPTLVLGILSLVTIIGLRFVAPKVPGALVLVVGGLLASRVLDLADHGIATVGDVPRGLPAPQIPDAWVFQDHLATIGVASLALFLIGFSQTAGDARLFAGRHQYRIDVNQESVAQGMANAGAGIFQGMPVSTSLSASSLNDSAGAKTAMASIVAGAMVLLTLIVLAPLFSDLPKAVLGALIIDAVVFGMMDVGEMRRLWRVKRFDFWIAVLAILGVLTAGVLAGVVIGIVLSIGWLVYVSAHPVTQELGRRPGTHVFRPLDEYPDGETSPGMLVLRFDGSLFFVTADPLEDRLRHAVLSATEPMTSVILDFAGVDFVDSQGSAKLGEILSLAERAGISLRLARVKPQVLAVFRADGVAQRLGEDRIHGNVDDAVTAEQASAVEEA